jgi:hypothetical protein
MFQVMFRIHVSRLTYPDSQSKYTRPIRSLDSACRDSYRSFTMRKAKKHPVWVAVLYIAAAVALAFAPWAVSGVQAAGQGASGHPRPLMPGNQPAGTSLNQATPGSTMGTNAQRPAQQGKPTPSPRPPVTSVPPVESTSSTPARGTR